MDNNFDTVAEDILSTETSADDAQAALSAEELMQDLTGGTQTAENEGDGDPGAQKQADPQQSKDDKFSKRMRAALANQKRQLYAELGGSEEEIREIIRAHKAQKLSTENPKISPEAARIIVEEREKVQTTQPASNSEIVAGIQGLIEDGWTREMLSDFVRDEIVQEQINEEGVSVRKAAFAYLNRARGQQTASKKSVPTLRTATAAGARDVDRIEEMTPDEFKAFRKRVEAARANGKKVRL
jgi:hypothetical protein